MHTILLTFSPKILRKKSFSSVLDLLICSFFFFFFFVEVFSMASLSHALGFFLCVVVLIIQKSCATQFLVGGKGQWGGANSTTNYNQWAEKNRFQIGDTLVFNFQSGQDSVLQVNKEAYTNCSTTDTPPMANFTGGHAAFTFNSSGAFYFISGNKDNCLKNEKLVVIVLADRTQKNSSSPPTPSPAVSEEINPAPTLAPETPPNAASSTSIGLASSIVGAVFAASYLVLGF